MTASLLLFPLLLGLGTPLSAQEGGAGAAAQDDPFLDDDDFFDDDLDALLLGEDPGTGESGVLRGWKGFVQLTPRSYLRDRGGPKNDEQLLFETEFEFDLRFRENLSGYVRPNLLIDLSDGEVLRALPLEAYVTFERDEWDLRAGLLVENWGIVDTYNPLDILNRRDISGDVLDAERLGELGVRYRRIFGGSATFGEPTLSLYALPHFEALPFPAEDQRFSFEGGVPPFNEDAGFEPSGSDELFFAARAQSTLNTKLFNADIHLLAAHGPDRTPSLFGEPTQLIPVYFGAGTVGFGIRAVPNEDAAGSQAALLTIKAEVAYTNPYTFDGSPIDTPDDYWAYVLGVDRTFDRPFGDVDSLTMTVEYAGESGTEDFTSLFRPFRDDVVLRAFWEANDFARQSLELRAIIDLDVDEQIYEALYERQLRSAHEDLRLIVHAQVIQSADPGESFFSLFPDSSSLAIGLRFDF